MSPTRGGRDHRAARPRASRASAPPESRAPESRPPEVRAPASRAPKARAPAFAAASAAALALGLAALPLHAADPTLRLDLTSPSGPIEVGEVVQVALAMTDLAAHQAAGFQAFLHYDTTKLEFLNASYSSAPFGLAIIWPINATPAGDIDLAAGINTFIGQTPSSADAVLAFIAFEATQGSCEVPQVEFRAHNPPTRLTTNAGDPILPLVLIDLQTSINPCPADVDDSLVVDVLDLLAVINAWGACPSDPLVCCPADTDNSDEVDVLDLLAVINAWGPCR